jgi:hypothetical protein
MSTQKLNDNNDNIDDIATQKLNELRARASKDFSKKEIDEFITAGKTLASKAVLSLLICTLKEGPAKGFNEIESRKLIKKI